MRIVLLGGPGAGKGSQAVNITKAMNIPHISTGDIFRANIKEGTELGKLAKQYIDAGKLVPDEVTVGIVKERILKDDCKDGFLLDGFPRTIPQAESLDKVLTDAEVKIGAVINLVVEDQTIIDRLSQRRVCECGRTYHLKHSPPAVEGICDDCKGELVIRKDDVPETIKARLETYHEQTEPLVEYYDDKGILINIDGSGNIADITSEILDELNKNK